MKTLKFTAISILFFISVQAFAQQKVWVSSKEAELKADKTASSQTLEKLETGTELNVLSFESRWYNVSSPSGQKGWIYRGKVSDSFPEKDEQGNISDNFDSGIILAAADTSRSIRGPEDELFYAENIEDKYLKALNEILSFYISDDEIKNFLKSGHIGEYAQE